MKRLVAGLVSALLIVVASQASAAIIEKNVPLMWRSALLTAINGYAPDSSLMQNGSGMHSDTSAAIPTAGLRLGGWGSNTALATDTTVAMTLVIHKQPGSPPNGSSGDTLYATLQGSFDGNTWTTFTGINQHYSAAGTPGTVNALLEHGGSSGEEYYRQYMANATAAGATLSVGRLPASGTDPNVCHFMGYPLIRFIVSGDHTGPYVGYLNAYWEESQVP